jgi:hypothetical protein
MSSSFTVIVPWIFQIFCSNNFRCGWCDSSGKNVYITIYLFPDLTKINQSYSFFHFRTFDPMKDHQEFLHEAVVTEPAFWPFQSIKYCRACWCSGKHRKDLSWRIVAEITWFTGSCQRKWPMWDFWRAMHEICSVEPIQEPSPRCESAPHCNARENLNQIAYRVHVKFGIIKLWLSENVERVVLVDSHWSRRLLMIE